MELKKNLIMKDIIFILQIAIMIQEDLEKQLMYTKNELNWVDGKKKYGLVILRLGWHIKINQILLC